LRNPTPTRTPLYPTRNPHGLRNPWQTLKATIFTHYLITSTAYVMTEILFVYKGLSPYYNSYYDVITSIVRNFSYKALCGFPTWRYGFYFKFYDCWCHTLPWFLSHHCFQMQWFSVIIEYLRQFSSILCENRIIVFTLKIRIDRYNNIDIYIMMTFLYSLERISINLLHNSQLLISQTLSIIWWAL
jgi:hypothetical protein